MSVTPSDGQVMVFGLWLTFSDRARSVPAHGGGVTEQDSRVGQKGATWTVAFSQSCQKRWPRWICPAWLRQIHLGLFGNSEWPEIIAPRVSLWQWSVLWRRSSLSAERVPASNRQRAGRTETAQDFSASRKYSGICVEWGCLLIRDKQLDECTLVSERV